ncbi:MAG: PEP-CTERM sorting domain-containing protein [Acidobacteria bacterium]|nr:PEP-CTERM sorting domain-containing protein [Acidobacteriota bacterium]
MLAALVVSVAPSYAGIIFTFTESGGNVFMNSSGVIDTNGLILQAGVSEWGGTGIEYNGNHDVMGGTSFGQVDMSFGFNPGTDFSPWAPLGAPAHPWATSVFGWTVDGGTKSFTTHIVDGGIQVPGLGVRGVDLVGGLWSPDQSWSIAGQTFASLFMIPGTSYTVTDALTDEFITFQIGGASPVPEPTTMLLFGGGLAALFLRRRKTQAN